MSDEPSPAALAEYRRLEALDQANVWEQYEKRFREGPPMQAWSGSQEGIERLMREAIEKGEPLTPEKLWEAQGLEPSTPDVDW